MTRDLRSVDVSQYTTERMDNGGGRSQSRKVTGEEDLGSAIPGRLHPLLCKRRGDANYQRADGSAWHYCPNCGAEVIDA